MKEYDIRVDAKGRILLKKPHFRIYHVEEFENGFIRLTPRYLARPEELRPEVLKRIGSTRK